MLTDVQTPLPWDPLSSPYRLTDLAGAEPTPLGGCEKFVTKFPLNVLNRLRVIRTHKSI